MICRNVPVARTSLAVTSELVPKHWFRRMQDMRGPHLQERKQQSLSSEAHDIGVDAYEDF